MKKTRIKSAILLSMGATIAARAVTTLAREIGQLSEEVDRGYPSANDLPIAGHPGFPDTSGVRNAGTAAAARPAQRSAAAIV